MSHLVPISTTTDARVRQAKTAILPIGSFEQHGPYLPLTTDTLVACAISRAIADSYPVLELSPLTITCSHEHKAWPGTVSISARTLHAVVSDIHQSLQQSGINKLVLVNAHGGNYALRNIVQEANVSGPHMAFFPENSDWTTARVAASMTTSNHEDMHGGELETSILLHAYPEVVRTGYETADHIADDRTGLLTLGMAHYTESGIIGRPSLASATKGKTALTSIVNSFADCLAMMTKNE
jgi:creatinine amidohydrolase